MKSQYRLRHSIAALQLLLALPVVEALVSPHNVPSSLCRVRLQRDERVQVIRLSNNNNKDEGEEIYIYNKQSRFFTYTEAANTTTTSSNNGTHHHYLDDLTPPPINWARDSILFSNNPATKRNNALVKTWSICRQYLPPLFTGAWPWRDPAIMDRNPLGAVYNMIVVRIPTMAIAVVYIHNLLDGYPLIMDFGQGGYEMSPVVVFSVLVLILA